MLLTTEIIYFPTREEARLYAEATGGYIKDAGKGSPKGRRWFV